jgi:ADP-heptose:LPS heptosyltransferase
MARGSFPILFITATRIGDAVLSSGLIKRLADEIPNARFTIVAGPAAAPLFADVPGLDQLIVFEKARSGGHWFDLWRKVRRRKWGLIVDLRGSGISRFLSTRRRAIFRKTTGEPVHKVMEAARTLRIEDQPAPPHIYVSEETDALAAELTQGYGPILAIAPAANWIGKTWPVERFSQVAMRLLGPAGPMRGGRLMILGGPEDAQVALQLKDVVMRKQLIDLTGRTDLLGSYAALKRARIYIGNDSGTTHLAAAAGVPTLALFGPSDDRLYAPWGEHSRVVRGPRSFEQVKTADPGLSQQVCHMMDLSVDTVAKAAEDLLATIEPSRRETRHG